MRSARNGPSSVSRRRLVATVGVTGTWTVNPGQAVDRYDDSYPAIGLLNAAIVVKYRRSRGIQISEIRGVAARCLVAVSLLFASAPVSVGAADQESEAEAVRVEVAKVVAGPLNEQVTAVGTLPSDEAVTISSEIPRRLEAIHFEEGNRRREQRQATVNCTPEDWP